MSHIQKPDFDPQKIEFKDFRFSNRYGSEIQEFANSYYVNYQQVQKMPDGLWYHVDSLNEFCDFKEFIEYCLDKPKIKLAKEWFQLVLNEIILSREDSNLIQYSWRGKNVLERDLVNNRIWVNYKLIWSVFENDYKLEHGGIQLFLKMLLEQHLQWSSNTPLRLMM